jgi:hypothetical protein
MVRTGNADTFTFFEFDENCRNFRPVLVADINQVVFFEGIDEGKIRSGHIELRMVVGNLIIT